jgi:hypothetical protein
MEAVHESMMCCVAVTRLSRLLLFGWVPYEAIPMFLMSRYPKTSHHPAVSAKGLPMPLPGETLLPVRWCLRHPRIWTFPGFDRAWLVIDASLHLMVWPSGTDKERFGSNDFQS